MKQGMKFLLCIVACLLFSCMFALAETDIDIFTDEYMYQNDFSDENGRYYFQSIDMDGGVFYAYLTDQYVYTYTPGYEPEQLCYLPSVPDSLSLICNTLTEDEKHQLDNSVTYITAFDGLLYGYNIYSGKFGVINENGINWYDDVDLDFSCLFQPDRFFPYPVLQSFMTSEELFTFVIEYFEYDDARFAIYGFNISTGKSRKLEVNGLCGVGRAGAEAFICLRFADGEYAISMLNPYTGTMEDLNISLSALGENEVIGGIAYDQETKTICIAASNKLYKSVSGSDFIAVGSVSTNYLLSEVQAWILPDGRYAILLDGLHIRGTNNVHIDRDLVIAGGVVLNAMKAFNAAYPDIHLQFSDWVNAEDFSRHVTTRDDSIDIFIVKADYAFTNMKKKGYAATLSGSEIIMNSVAEMDRNIAEVILDDDGNAIAYPHTLSIWDYGVNEGYWHMLWPDRPLPKTFDDVLDAWIEWERDLAQDYQGVGFVAANFDYAQWIYNFISIFVMQQDADGPINTDSPGLRSVLTKLREVYEIRAANGRSTKQSQQDTQLIINSETGPGFIFIVSPHNAMTDLTPSGYTPSDSYLYGVLKHRVTRIPIVFDGVAVAQTNARMYLYVVNPYSKRMDDAIRFIECASRLEVDHKLYYALRPNINQPYENPDYEQIRAAYTEQKESYEDAIRRAKESKQSYNTNMEARVQFYDTWLADESNRWLIKRSTIEEFRRKVRENPLAVHADSPYLCDEGTNVYKIIMSACDKYANGVLTLDALLNEISEKTQMIYSEDQ